VTEELQLRAYEIEATRLLLSEGKMNTDAEVLLREGRVTSVEHTGVGHFLTLRHDTLPIYRHVLGRPVLSGAGPRGEVGFVAFVQDHELMFECYTSEDEVPLTIRDSNVCLKRSNSEFQPPPSTNQPGVDR
jgi:hypothetical protein